jgi:hypothetical protein
MTVVAARCVAAGVAALVMASCGGDDSGARPAVEVRRDVGEPCSWLDPDDLDMVTGLEFSRGVSDAGQSCTYTASDGKAALTLSVVEMASGLADDYRDRAALTCDAGTVEDVRRSDGGTAFTCLVGDVPTAAGPGQGAFVVLVGLAGAGDRADPAGIRQVLATLLDRAVSGGRRAGET